MSAGCRQEYQGLCQGNIIFPVQVGLDKSSFVIMGVQGLPTSMGHQLYGSIKNNEAHNIKTTNITYLVLLINSNQNQIEFDLM